MMEAVSILNPMEKNIIMFLDMFHIHGHTCLAFEMLDRDLYQLMMDRQWKQLSPAEIRPIAHQVKTTWL